jgi:hypothetical protein
VSVATDVLPILPALLTCTLLILVPGVVPVTFTVITHDAPAASVAPDKLADVAPAMAVAVPPQLLVKPLGEATTMPSGRRSVKATPDSGTVAFALASVNVNDVPWLNSIAAAPNTLVIVGGATTVTEALDVLPTPSSKVTCTVLFFTPGVVLVTLTATVQEAPPASVAPASCACDAPATAVTVPPQVFDNALGVASVMPAGRLSMKPMSASDTAAFGLARVNVSDVVAPTSTVAPPKTFAIVGGAGDTCSEACEISPVPPFVALACTLLFFIPRVVPVT